MNGVKTAVLEHQVEVQVADGNQGSQETPRSYILQIVFFIKNRISNRNEETRIVILIRNPYELLLDTQIRSVLYFFYREKR